MNLNCTVGIIGPICSGKTFLANTISRDINISIVSFGKYLFEFSNERGWPVTREALQELGNKLIKEDSSRLLKDVLKHQPNKNIIVEGIRHRKILNELKEMSRKSIFIYIDLPEILRYERYNSRLKESDSQVSFEEFIELNNHEVEAEIRTLEELCDINFKQEDFSTGNLMVQIRSLLTN